MTRTHSVAGTANGARSRPLAVDVQARGSALVATLSGDLDLAAGERFEQIHEALRHGDFCDLVIDLRDVVFMDSTGLRLLLGTERIARERRLRLWIVRGGAAVDRALRITGMDKVLPLVDNPPDFRS